MSTAMQDNNTDLTASGDHSEVATGAALAADLNAVLLKLAVNHFRAKQATKAETASKAAVAKVLGRGATQMAGNPLRPDQEIAQVTVSKATYTATVVDQAAVEEWVRENYADKVEKRTKILGNDEDVLNILKTFAPYLIEEEEVVPEHVFRELELRSGHARTAAGFGGEVGEDAPPGIEVFVSTPKISVTFRNASLIDDLLIAGVIDADGNVIAKVDGGEE
ncbi:hypothetical protein [Umezawaea tangerina]|uniref:Uncharacterized protein n=1 Tax=Umezawaea tangerina TaxID=84725 RepID=A0A2T0SPE4_9PSEU|nr:hypothetical protein [Umezawaea tangerina]PRY35278.1 hypothetical protein CLV43_114196 [Umezawaea tangerina]